jgi:gamma-glutamyltranspeptidase/glutathione hydrolase/leukotriene-C4 hydrolase
MKLMERYDDLYPNSGKSLQKSALFYHRLIETFKYAYSYRTLLGDYKFDDVNDVIKNLTSDEFIDNIRKSIDDTKTYSINSGRYGNTIHVVEDHGTAHVSVIDKFGNAAAVSSTINS